MLDIAILEQLRHGPRHGYDLQRRLESDHGLHTSYGAIYPALKRMEAKNFIAAVDSNDRRKAYRITDNGQEHLIAQALEEPDHVESAQRFGVRLSVFDLLTRRERNEILVMRRRRILKDLAHAVSSRRSAATDAYKRSHAAHVHAALNNELAFIDELVAITRTEQPSQAVVPLRRNS